MNKLEYLSALKERLSGLPQKEVEERLGFYSEMIEDRVEEGLSEAEAVAAVGSVDEIAVQIMAESSFVKPGKGAVPSKRRMTVREIVLLALGFPLWLPLLIAAFVVILSLDVSMWAVIISLWSVFGALIVCAAAGVTAGIGFVPGGHTFTGIAVIGAGVACAGLTIMLYFGCRAATKGAWLLTRNGAIWIQNCFVRRKA